MGQRLYVDRRPSLTQEAQNHDDVDDRLKRSLLERTDIDRLRWLDPCGRNRMESSPESSHEASCPRGRQRCLSLPDCPSSCVGRARRTGFTLPTHKVSTLHIKTGELDATAKEATAGGLCHVGEDVLNVTMTEGLVLEVRVARNVT